MPFTKEQIRDLYRQEAARHGAGGTSTIQDIRTRDLEISAIRKHLSDGLSVLEVGCGNGYTAEALAREFAIQIEAFDYSEELVALAKERDLRGLRGSASFAFGDVLNYQAGGSSSTWCSPNGASRIW